MRTTYVHQLHFQANQGHSSELDSIQLPQLYSSKYKLALMVSFVKCPPPCESLHKRHKTDTHLTCKVGPLDIVHPVGNHF